MTNPRPYAAPLLFVLAALAALAAALQGWATMGGDIYAAFAGSLRAWCL